MPRQRSREDPSLPIIGRNLKAIRIDLGLKQGAVAALAGVDRAMLSRYEKGKSKPELDTIVRLAAVYRCSLDDLAAGVHPPYDDIVAEGIAAEPRRFYEARLAAVREAALTMVREHVLAGEIAPKTTGRGATGAAKNEKSQSARARRKPKM